MYCIECGNRLPDVRNDSTVCSKCKTPLATWWDETSQTYRTNRESILPSATPPFGDKSMMSQRKNTQTIEERNFQAALLGLEIRFEETPGFGAKSIPNSKPDVKKMVTSTLEMSLHKSDVRENLAKNVEIWARLKKIFDLAIHTLSKHSLRDPSPDNTVSEDLDILQTTDLILKNYDSLVEDLHYLNNLLVITRNMLALKETAQEICSRVQFDRTVHDLIILCVNVTSKGYDGECVDELKRGKVNNVTELYKKLLVTALQHTHNWTMGNDRFKMLFWFEMLFDDDLNNDTIHELPPDDLNVKTVHEEIMNWLRRHSRRDKAASDLLEKYSADVELGPSAGALPEEIDTSIWHSKPEESLSPVWKPDLEDKYEQDRLYARVSHEIDVWWKRVRDANYEGWVVPMESVEGAIARAVSCKENAMHRYMPRGQDLDHNYTQEEHYDEQPEDGVDGDDIDDRSVREDNGLEDDDVEDEDEDEDDSYVEGPLRGLLTEIPNILDTKQIEALHMTVKACIVDSMGSGLTPSGENLQKTRCKMFLALDCGKNLLREMLVFIAVWEQTDQQFIFQITAQIIESFHHNALLPYAWNSLRILKDIVSPAQTVLLRLINYMFRARKDSPIYDDVRDYNRDAKLIHFLYKYFRCRVVPDCIALIYAQAQIRQGKSHPSDFPVDLWDMERAKDGLSQYLDFISVIAEIPEMRPLLIEWEAIYELTALLRALEDGVERKGIDTRHIPEPSRPAATQGSGSGSSTPIVERPYDENNSQGGQPQPRPPPSFPPLHDEPHKFPWSGIKVQILIILTSLVAPNNPRRSGPGNPTVQRQLLDREGIMPLLNCCVYDGHNEYLKERATLAIKFVMEGCEEAQKFVRELVAIKPGEAQTQTQGQSSSQGPTPIPGKPFGIVPPSSASTLAAAAAARARAQDEASNGGAKPGDKKQAELLDDAARLVAVAQSIKENTDEYARVMARGQSSRRTPKGDEL